jgi:LytS/YehU family sensor histidine kinase
LKFSIEIEPGLEDVLIPGFILQILAENAIEHGTSQLIKPAVGHIQIRACLKELELVEITVEDNAGLYREENVKKAQDNNRYGMQMVQDLIRTQFNSNQYGLSVDCEPGVYTKVILTLPRRFEIDT